MQPAKPKKQKRILSKKWLHRIAQEKKAHEEWRKRAKDVEKVYRANIGGKATFYPLLHSVVEVQHSGVYSNQPVPDCRSRGNDSNPINTQVIEVLNRAITYQMDCTRFDDGMHRAIDDWLVTGLGIMRVSLDSDISEVPAADPMGMPMLGPDGQPVMQPQVSNQKVVWKYTPWKRFRWEPCSCWEDCDWVAFDHRLTVKEIENRWGVKVGNAGKEDKSATDEYQPRVTVHEIWSKPNRKVVWIADGHNEILEVEDDPLGLKEFYPCPPPLWLNLKSGELLPQPDYDFIQKHDQELNRIAQRRMAVLEQLKVVGLHDASLTELADLAEVQDGQSIGVANLMDRLGASGLATFDAVISFLPLEEKARVVDILTGQMQVVRSQVDELLGISDIVRGVTQASETATAQEIKGRWVGVRMSRKREAVQYFVRDMFRITADMVAEHVTDEELAQMTQMQMAPEVTQVLRSDQRREYAVDVESESTIAKDEFKERETRQEMLAQVGQFAASVLPAVQQGNMPADVSTEILKAALQPYTRYSRALGDALETLPDTQQQLTQLTQQNQEAQGQVQQLTAQTQQQQQYIQYLEQQAVEATAAQKNADAALKDAKTQETLAGLPDDGAQAGKTAAETQKTKAETLKLMRESNQTITPIGGGMQ